MRQAYWTRIFLAETLRATLFVTRVCALSDVFAPFDVSAFFGEIFFSATWNLLRSSAPPSGAVHGEHPAPPEAPRVCRTSPTSV